MNVKIYVSTHKKYDFPQDDIYIPVQVGIDEGVELLGYQGDNTGDNISYKHRYYSDLSTVYWAWKNSDADYIGACHYRRYFISTKKKNRGIKKFKYILSKNEILSILSNSDIVVPKKRNYYIETIESHFKHTHTASDFDILREVIDTKFNNYLESFNFVANSKSAHLFNCYIMKKEKFDSFCSFLFSVLFEVEKRIDFSNRTEFESRTCGYLAEFLLDTWLRYNNFQYTEVKLSVIEGEKRIKKAIAFLKAKFFGVKYDKSF